MHPRIAGWGRGAAAALAAAVALEVGGPARAGEVRVVPDRPDHAQSLETVPPGLAQVEGGVAYLRDASGDRPARIFSVEGNFRLGLAEGVEISVSSDLFVRERSEGQGTSGLGDTLLAGKWRLVDDEGWRPALGVLPFVKFPTASRSKGLGSGRVDFGGLLAATKDLPADLHVDFNFGLAAVSLAEAPGGLFLQKTAAASFSWAPTEWVSPFWEIFYESRDRPAGRPAVGTDFGAIVWLHRRVAVDASAEFGLAGATPNWVVRAGFAVLLGPLPDGDSRSGTRRAPSVEASQGRMAHGTSGRERR